MITLSNDQLKVSILDPIEDRVRLGGRYCVGGYIYQVEDASLGVLVSGPGYPAEEYPPVFDGQGLPESFRRRLYPGEGNVELAIGVGLVEKDSQTVREFGDWMVVQKPDTVVMTMFHRFGGWFFVLTREVRLAYRTISSETWLQNIGPLEIPVQWFPHPFYPWHESGECCKFNVPVTFPENPGYEMRPSGFIARKLDHEWDRRGHLQLLGLEPQARLSIVERHPKVGLVTATCDYPATWMPIWGNCNTFSFEPYYEMVVPGGQIQRWAIIYDF